MQTIGIIRNAELINSDSLTKVHVLTKNLRLFEPHFVYQH